MFKIKHILEESKESRRYSLLKAGYGNLATNVGVLLICSIVVECKATIKWTVNVNSIDVFFDGADIMLTDEDGVILVFKVNEPNKSSYIGCHTFSKDGKYMGCSKITIDDIKEKMVPDEIS